MRLPLWGLLALILHLTEVAQAVPLDTIGTFCSTFPSQCAKGTTSLLAARGTGTNAYYVMEVDPATGSLPFSVTIPANGATGAAVPAQADYQGLNNGGVLIGAIGDSSGRTIVAGAGTAGTPAGGVLTVQGVTSMTPLTVTLSATSPSTAGRAYATSVRYTYVTANVGVTNWVQLIASTAAVINCIELFDSSGQTLELGTGAAASETRKLIIPPGGLDGCVPLAIPASTRVSIRALSATTGDVGEINITGFQ